MPPPNGMNPRIVFTIQPEDVSFDPPAPIVYHNVCGYLAGRIVNLYSFDHELGQWVSIGTGSVTEDGAFIASDPGVGIVHGGWHFPEPPPEKDTKAEGEMDIDGPLPPLTEANFNEWIQKAKDFLRSLNNPKINDVLDAIGTISFDPTMDNKYAEFFSLGKPFDNLIVFGPLNIRDGNAESMNTLLHEGYHALADKLLLLGLPDRDGDKLVDSIDPNPDVPVPVEFITLPNGDKIQKDPGDVGGPDNCAACIFAGQNNPLSPPK